jgi:hypothetical protein
MRPCLAVIVPILHDPPGTEMLTGFSAASTTIARIERIHSQSRTIA